MDGKNCGEERDQDAAFDDAVSEMVDSASGGPDGPFGQLGFFRDDEDASDGALLGPAAGDHLAPSTPLANPSRRDISRWEV
ncbi:hypothetical protein GN244_ATG02616 [Phytophthora infestans]|uniref:Uncharacterized protein n=1 Tax=Phytophthora infestans TaxID=4787 RepID=A0A833WM19_PHYIN|nr:hypothetical protein GN244_ATG02616 [Phytophthora infestans]